jgi:hypothetical protein
MVGAVSLRSVVLHRADAGNQREEVMARCNTGSARARSNADSRPPQISFASDTDRARHGKALV